MNEVAARLTGRSPSDRGARDWRDAALPAHDKAALKFNRRRVHHQSRRRDGTSRIIRGVGSLTCINRNGTAWH